MARKRESRLELAAKYQQWADEAPRWHATMPGLREDYLKLAMGRHALADEINDEVPPASVRALF